MKNVKFISGAVYFQFLSENEDNDRFQVFVSNVPKQYNKGGVRGISGGKTINMGQDSTRTSTNTQYREGIISPNAQSELTANDFRQYKYGDVLLGYAFTNTANNKGKYFVEVLDTLSDEQLDALESKCYELNGEYIAKQAEKSGVQTPKYPFTVSDVISATSPKIKKWAEEFSVTGESVQDLRLGLHKLLK